MRHNLLFIPFLICLCACQTQTVSRPAGNELGPPLPPVPQAKVHRAPLVPAGPAKSLSPKIEWVYGGPVSIDTSANLKVWTHYTNAPASQTSIAISTPAPAQFFRVISSNSVTLAWDPVPDPSVLGYKVYVGVDPGIYTNSVDVGLRTMAVLPNLQPLCHYHFAATCYNASFESDYSAEALFFSGAPWNSPVPMKISPH